jgi:hypothetical protein
MTHIPANANPTGHRVSVYADPACPWTWVTSQWLREVALHRNLDLRCRSLSLCLRDTDQPAAGVPAQIRTQAAAARAQSHRLLRFRGHPRHLPRARHRLPLPPVGRAGLLTIAAARTAWTTPHQ